MSLPYVIPSLLELSLHLPDTTFPKMFAQQLREDLLARFAIFNPLALAVCLLQPVCWTQLCQPF